jgi:hypothetical protein
MICLPYSGNLESMIKAIGFFDASKTKILETGFRLVRPSEFSNMKKGL